VKLKLLYVYVFSVIYASETWTLNKLDKDSSAFEMKCYR